MICSKHWSHINQQLCFSQFDFLVFLLLITKISLKNCQFFGTKCTCLRTVLFMLYLELPFNWSNISQFMMLQMSMEVGINKNGQLKLVQFPSSSNVQAQPPTSVHILIPISHTKTISCQIRPFKLDIEFSVFFFFIFN